MPRRGKSGDSTPVNLPEVSLPEHLADYEWARAIVAGDAEARSRFTREYGEKIRQTAYLWCKPFLTRSSPLRLAELRSLK